MNAFANSVKHYYRLTKPRIVFMVLVTAVWGYFLALNGSFLDMLIEFRFWMTMLGTGLGAAGAAVLNQYVERDADAIMKRTQGRPIPSGLVSPLGALVFGLWLNLLGLGILLWQVNILTAFLVLYTNFLYVLVYTPMKRFSELNISFGAVPGAIPPLIGCTAVTGEFTLEGFVLFMILFIWQHPHVYAIQWMCRDDFARAGFKMLAVRDDGSKTRQYVILGTLALIVVSMFPTLLGMSSMIYLALALVSGIGLLIAGVRMTSSLSYTSAFGFMKATVFYLPLILVGLVVDALL
jgi:protoheme IX farnesyltransferase